MESKIEFISEKINLNKAEKFVEEINKEFNLSEVVYGNILVSVKEAINKAIVHGNNLDKTKNVGLECEISKKEISFKVSDDGQGFDFDNIPDPTLPENIEKLNGRGVFLIKNLSDKMEFFNNGSVIEFKFNI